MAAGPLEDRPEAAPAGRGKADDPARLTPRLRAILGIVIVASMLDLMDSQITNIAAPSIVRELGGGESLIKWLGASYQLAIGTFLVIGGRLGDRYGKRRLYPAGIAGFVAASLICGLAADPAVIIVGRFLQGTFGALLIPARPALPMLQARPRGDRIALTGSPHRQANRGITLIGRLPAPPSRPEAWSRTSEARLARTALPARPTVRPPARVLADARARLTGCGQPGSPRRSTP